MPAMKFVFDPAYDSYDPCGTFNGGVAHHLPLRYPDFCVDWQQVRDTIVAVIPISVFYKNPPDQRIVRFCFAKHDDTLREAGQRLK